MSGRWPARTARLRRASRRDPGSRPPPPPGPRRRSRRRPSVAPPRWRARASSDVAVRASVAWTRRSSSGPARAMTAWARSGWLKRIAWRSTATMPAASAGSSARGASGSARRRVSIVGSAATAASSSAARVAGGRAPIRASTRAPSVSGIGRRSPGRHDRPGSGEVAGDLEGVEGIATRRLLDPDQHQPRERPAGSGQEQLVQRRQGQRAHVAAAHAARRETPAVSSRTGAAGSPRTARRTPAGRSTRRRIA